MTFNGSGSFVRTDGVRTGDNVCQQQANADVPLSPVLFDTELNNIATALGDCVTKNGETGALTAPLHMGGQKIISLLTPTSRTDAANFAAVQNQTCNWGGATTGSGGNYIVTLTPSPSNLSTGLIVRCKLNHTTLSPILSEMTLSVNGFISSIEAPAGFGLVVNDLVTFLYDGTKFLIMELRRPSLSYAPAIEASSSGSGSISSIVVSFATYTYSQIFRGIEFQIHFQLTTSTGFTKSILIDVPFPSPLALAKKESFLGAYQNASAEAPVRAMVQASFFGDETLVLRVPNQTTGEIAFPSNSTLHFSLGGIYSV